VTTRYPYFVLTVLLLVHIFNFIDRQVLTILLEPIKAEFGASDTAMGFLSGFAFAVLYATMGVPVARLADNWSRTRVLAAGAFIWSAMTTLCGMATSFWQLAMYRLGVGVGEAGGTPPSHALIAAYFPVEKRSSAMAVYASGSQFGVLIGLFGGALIAEAYGWRAVFFAFGVPGMLLGLVVLATIREPAQRPTPSGQSMWQDVQHLWRVQSLVALAVAAGLTALAGYGMGAWFPSFLIRVHGMSLSEAGLVLGLVGTLGSLIGGISGGVICDRLAARDARWQLRFPAIGAAASVLFLGLFLTWPESQFWMLGDFHVPVAVQALTPEHLRAQASAMLLLLLNLIGMGLGPLLVGVLSDLLHGELAQQSVRYAMVISLVTVIGGALVYWRASSDYAQALARLR
jgi:predicted MFS family arabinose efflux permease